MPTAAIASLTDAQGAFRGEGAELGPLAFVGRLLDAWEEPFDVDTSVKVDEVGLGRQRRHDAGGAKALLERPEMDAGRVHKIEKADVIGDEAIEDVLRDVFYRAPIDRVDGFDLHEMSVGDERIDDPGRRPQRVDHDLRCRSGKRRIVDV